MFFPGPGTSSSKVVVPPNVHESLIISNYVVELDPGVLLYIILHDAPLQFVHTMVAVAKQNISLKYC